MANRRGGTAEAVVRLSTGPLTVSEVLAVARGGARVEISPGAVAAMKASRAVVERALTDGQPHYGINTGFGSLSRQRINAQDLATLQRNLVRSHAAGVGEPLPAETARAMMLLLCASLSRGHSGVRPVVAGTIAEMLNAPEGGVVPVVPSLGSVGASGDLAPLAAVANVLIGEGRARFRGREMSGGAALAAASIVPLTLDAKEGLALINGTHLMAAQGALLVHDVGVLFPAALAAVAMSIDACRATDTFLDDRLYAARGHAETRLVAAELRKLLVGSRIVKSHVENDPRVQDPYSLRAAPTVLGAALAAVESLRRTVEGELGAVTDNPLVFPGAVPGGRGGRHRTASGGEIVSGANFHGMPLAIPLDVLAIALCHVAGISERRTYLMTSAFEPESRLKPFLAPRPGLQSGLMIAQYTAAACVNELVGLAAPASVANVPTCAGMEDYNSFGPRSASKARRGVELCRMVVAIELLCAAAGVEEHRPLRSGVGVERALAAVRGVVAAPGEDRALTRDIEQVAELIARGGLAG